jgi:hypothetical protein
MKKTLLGLLLITGLASCYNDKYDKLYPVPATHIVTCDSAGSISYTKSVKPVIAANCAISGCHIASGTTGYDYTDTTVLKANSLAGWVVQDINFMPSGRGHNNMPLAGNKLSACNIAIITNWVTQGANCSN